MRSNDTTTTLAARLLDLAAELRAVATVLLERETAADFDARVSALLDRVHADQDAAGGR